MGRSSIVEKIQTIASKRGLKLALFSAGFVGILLFLVLLLALPGAVRIEGDVRLDGRHGDDASRVLWSSDDLKHRTTSSRSRRDRRGDIPAAVDWDEDDTFDVATLGRGDDVEFDCMIEPWESVSVRSPVIGRIDAIHVERADVVKRGDLLIELDSDLSRAELGVARQRAEMTASIHSSEARRRLGHQRAERARELFSRNALAADERDEIEVEGEVAEWTLQEAIDEQVLAQRQLEREEARFERRRIRSPFDGVVSDRLMSVGEVVDEETVLELAQIDPLRVEVILPAGRFGTLRPGMKAAVVPEIPGDEVVLATIRVVDRIIDSASGTFGAELELPNPEHAIPGGLRCRVDFLDAAPEAEEHARAEMDPSSAP